MQLNHRDTTRVAKYLKREKKMKCEKSFFATFKDLADDAISVKAFGPYVPVVIYIIPSRSGVHEPPSLQCQGPLNRFKMSLTMNLGYYSSWHRLHLDKDGIKWS